MNAQEILTLISKLEKIKNPKDFEIVKQAVNSCLTVQVLRENLIKKEIV